MSSKPVRERFIRKTESAFLALDWALTVDMIIPIDWIAAALDENSNHTFEGLHRTGIGNCSHT